MAEKHEPATVEGMAWAIVVLVELSAPLIKALTPVLESAQLVVLVEGSMLRASVLVRVQQPHVVIAPASLPAERTQVMRDAAREIGTEVMLIGPNDDVNQLGESIRSAVARVASSRAGR